MSKDKVALVFPGQGSQAVGMGADLYQSHPAARAVFQQADEALGFPISRLCFEGPEAALRETVNAQPAIMTVSVAYLRAAPERLPAAPAFVAGHSLGEYSALVAAGVLDFPEAVRLVRERGRLMHEAGQRRPGSMAAILGMDEAAVAAVCQESGAQMANLNLPDQTVISGTAPAVAAAQELAKARGARRAVPLEVSGAFHSALMEPAVAGLAQAMAQLTFRDPQVPVVANGSARPLTTAAAVKEELLWQLAHPVMWHHSVSYMLSQGVSTFIEVGPGQVLSGLIRRLDKNVVVFHIARDGKAA